MDRLRLEVTVKFSFKMKKSLQRRWREMGKCLKKKKCAGQRFQSTEGPLPLENDKKIPRKACGMSWRQRREIYPLVPK